MIKINILFDVCLKSYHEGLPFGGEAQKQNHKDLGS